MRYFIFFLLIITTRFFGLNFLEQIVPHDDLNSVFSVILIVLSFFKRDLKARGFVRLKSFMRLTIVSVLLSFIVGYIDWGQSFMISFVASRSVFWISFGFFLIRYDVQKTDIVWALKYFTICYFLLTCLAVSSPTFTLLFMGLDYKDEINTEGLLRGMGFVVLFFYMYVEKMFKEKFVFKNYLWVFLMLFLFIIAENRTTLFSSLIILSGYLLSSKRFGFFYKIAVVVGVFAFGYMLFSETFIDLWNETISQVNDKDYNRNKAFDYIIFELNDSWYSKILGNGFASLHSKYGEIIHINLKSEGIYQSDLGMIGLWSIYGVLLLFGICKYIITIIRSDVSLGLKMQCYHLIIGFLMYSFVLSEQIVFFMLFFYVYELEKNKMKPLYSLT